MPGYDTIIKGLHRGPNAGRTTEDPVGQLADFAANTELPDIPGDVIEHAKRILMDTVGVILGGSTAPEATALARRFGQPDKGPSTIIGHGLRSCVLNAALTNGTSATWLDFDSGHRPPPGKPLLPAAHPPAHLVPATIAAAEALKSSGRQVLEAMVLGYDVGARIGLASRLRPAIHCHGTYHNISAAVAVSKLKGYNAEQMKQTIALAAHLTMMPSFENAYQGGTVRNVYAGAGASLGILASHLAACGFTPEIDAVGSVFGVVASPWLDPGRITEAIGKRYEITQGFIKAYPMCRFGHPAIEAAEGLLHKFDFDIKDIAEVVIDTFDWAATLNDRSPKKDLAAKFSIPWAVASMLVRKSAGAFEFSDEGLCDETVRSISAKITVREDPSYSSMTPAKRPARISLRTKSGQTIVNEVKGSSGGPDAPLSDETIQAKFKSLADPLIGAQRTATAIQTVDQLEELADICTFTELLMPENSISK
jgi:2-methylcitrate dehydratase PrpD